MKRSTKISEVSDMVLELEKRGLTPLDLLSWETLLVLTEKGSAGLFFETKVNDLLQEALERKADMMDEAQSTNFYTEFLRNVR